MFAEVLSLLYLFVVLIYQAQIVTEAKAVDDVSSTGQNNLLSLIVGGDKGKY